MAAPNLLSLTTLTAKTAGQAVTTSATAIVTNSSGSGKLIKITTLFISNVNGGASADITVDVYKNQSTAYRIGYTISVPADSTLDLINKVVYLEENDSLRLTASVNSYLEAVCSYEELS